jgi:hypothetical protein
MPELWLVEQHCQVIQRNMVTGVTYQFNTLDDAKAGFTLIQKEINKCLKGKNRRPFYPDFAIEACQKKGIHVFVL